jgi:hypothetical protein
VCRSAVTLSNRDIEVEVVASLPFQESSLHTMTFLLWTARHTLITEGSARILTLVHSTDKVTGLSATGTPLSDVTALRNAMWSLQALV